MKIRKEWLYTSIAAAAVLLTAIAVLIGANVGMAGADLSEKSKFLNSSVSLYDIGIALVENDTVIAERRYDSSSMDGKWVGDVNGQLFTAPSKNDSTMPSEDDVENKKDKVVLNQEYGEELAVRNTGTINEYVRVTIYKYWLKEDGETRLTDLSPDLISVNLADGWENNWSLDPSAHTEERDVYYYTSVLPSGSTTAPLTESVSISNAVAKELEQTQEGNTIITKYKYDGIYFVIEVAADGVQENNAQEAITSAWGVNISDFIN